MIAVLVGIAIVVPVETVIATAIDDAFHVRDPARSDALRVHVPARSDAIRVHVPAIGDVEAVLEIVTVVESDLEIGDIEVATGNAVDQRIGVAADPGIGGDRPLDPGGIGHHQNLKHLKGK